jgi:hypothetical protein
MNALRALPGAGRVVNGRLPEILWRYATAVEADEPSGALPVDAQDRQVRTRSTAAFAGALPR